MAPADVDQAKVEADLARPTSRSSRCADWRGDPEPTRFPIARLGYTKTTRQWTIYWRDRNLKSHEYRYSSPEERPALLDYIRESKDRS